MAVEIRVPQLAESVVEATVGKWFKAPGESVQQDEVITELATDKVNVEVFAPVAGILASIIHPEGDVVGPNELLATVTIAEGKEPAEAAAPSAAAVPQAAPAIVETHKTVATPVAEKMAAASGVNIEQIRGSGPNGKVTIEDVRQHVAAPAPTATPAAPAPQRSAPPQPALQPLAALLSTSLNRREEREPLSRLRLTIIRNLKQSETDAVRLTTFNEVDMTAIMDVRKRRRDAFKEKHGVNLGFMSFFTRACVGALKAFPYLNSEIQGNDVIKKFFYDIGIAVGTDKGLMVPVLRDADRKSFAEIEKEIGDLAKRAREGKISLPELLGGTFTITNGGTYGSLMSTPILNAPQTAILGMHKIQDRPMAVNGEVVIRPMMYLALSYDHRIVDGSDAVRFLVRVKDLLEDPEALLLEV
jgi:2-oxoglutarate dehydrogenase E2 component (dihydrolipoamide succinyltransferase)